ncbi:Hsp70 nucleotide exchange factor fes1 [Taphrina deformans PYCC 5710]|uniref:Hsp70 nucleotide exchange factor fes1 n=1 Tax=Taphrina deformans (strain PYCC 5710 / ATCC 11124 / CBS 356.35 / IMI 108563 / JCM 9778 / NBRC 8474) TaxID=1097556 RepID=R4XIX0_TAPDE|nr:Hsp70 nucleotide exchange factor fes1 [Taphrina deformans PYCC 5710]|eukprot:CCG83313.1 Hsp70 nucleotide exchange factor fes1 [Taphrina deformans PYCC 5710]
MSSKDKLKELLNYSTSLSSSTPQTSTTPGRKLDAAMLDELMGPDDAHLMLSSMTAIEATETSGEEREIAFENLEALVEQIDNAKNLQNLRLWQPVIAQLEKGDVTCRVGGCAVIATALQNNPVSQADFLTYGEGLAGLLRLFERDESVQVRRKALFGITAALRNCPAAQTRFEEIGGWIALSAFLDAVQDLNMLRRIVFYLGTLYASSVDLQDGSSAGVSESVKTGFPPKLVSLLGQPAVQDDEDLSEKLLYTLAQALKYDADVLNRELKDKLKGHAKMVKQRYGEEFYEGGELEGLL